MPYDIILGRNESEKKLFGKKGLAYIGRGYVQMGQYTSLSNNIFMDVAKSHVVLVAGKRGSGKSYTLGVIAEEISNLPKEVNQNIGSLIFDTMGIYWSMKYKNQKDRELLEEWKSAPKNLPVKVFIPFGQFDNYIRKGIPVDEKFALDIAELEPEDWIITFGLDIIHPISILIERIINNLKQKGKFNIDKIISEVELDIHSEKETKNATIGLFQAAKTWGIFSDDPEESTKIIDLINAGTTSVLDLSGYSSVGAFNVRALVIGLLCKKIFNQRMDSRKIEEVREVAKGLTFSSELTKKDIPLIWIFVDEAHEFLPKQGKTPATDALIQLLREGRQPGVSLVLATQQPGEIHRDVMTQSDIVISHRVTAAPDVAALNTIMQSYLLDSIKKYMDNLPSLKGSAIILDDNSERIYPMRIRPRFTWHGGEAPTAIPIEKKL